MCGDRGLRFTPTCVGTTCRPARVSGSRAVHPHVRGDNESERPDLKGRIGSPPCAWGQRSHTSTRCAGRRFTPTCVGTTGPRRRGGGDSAVHPHVRGDNSNCSSVRFAISGSPPRAWGQRVVGEIGAGPARFTPTCVGTTIPPVNQMEPEFGSPPRAWGQPVLSVPLGHHGRFTPTCVGTTTPRGT